MHGVKRVRYSKEALAARRERDQAKLKEYISLTDGILTRKKNEDLSQGAFDLTTQMLRMNPEFYTVWNYRRHIFIQGIFPNSSPAAINEFLSEDLGLTAAFLKQHPKVYWIWNHRRWCLEQVPDGPLDEDKDGWRMANWNKELFLVEKMLDVDPRNFHAWNYRRYVLASIPVRRSQVSELSYTTRKIESNFSNFSAWHQRSKVLASLWQAGELNVAQSREDELDLVKNAMYTDPDDQSVWIYHRWLIGDGDDSLLLQREIASIQELLDEQPDSKWCMESIVYYKTLLMRRHLSTMDTSVQQSLVRECFDLLAKLQYVDSNRKQRYIELSDEIKNTFL